MIVYGFSRIIPEGKTKQRQIRREKIMQEISRKLPKFAKLSTPRRRRRKQELQSLLKALKNPLAKFNSLGNNR